MKTFKDDGIHDVRKKELVNMAVMNKPVNLAFIVAEDKSEEFINSKTPAPVIDKIKKQAKEMMKHSTFMGEPWDKNTRGKTKD